MAIADAKAVTNVLFGYAFRANFTGYPAAMITKCDIPEREAEVATIGGGAQTLETKQAGGEKIGEFTVETLLPADGQERLFWEQWEADRRTRDTGKYYRDGTITLIGPNDEPRKVWDVQDAWPSKVKYEQFDSEDRKKLVRITVTMQCFDCVARIP